jgi:hypothetical protein
MTSDDFERALHGIAHACGQHIAVVREIVDGDGELLGQIVRGGYFRPAVETPAEGRTPRGGGYGRSAPRS